MAVLEYGLHAASTNGLLFEQKNQHYAISKAQSLSPNQGVTLEDEIRQLRSEMEQLAKNNLLTSQRVIEISRLLDLKINEYMQRKRK